MDRSAEAYELQKQRSREWKKRNRERHAELAKAYRDRNPEKYKANQKVNYAIKTGKLVRGNCEKCDATENIHGHHDDYSKPLEVRWLCFLCHKAEHPVSDEDKRIKKDDAQRAQLRGEENPNASLESATVRMIRRALDIGVSQDRIARTFGVHQTTVSRIKLGKHYSDVT